MNVERCVLDDAGLRAILRPRFIWTFIVDGATQKNFELVFKEIGDAHVLLSRMYHRSGASTARTVLAVFFYKIGRERTRLESAGVETDEQHEETQQGEIAEGACSSDSDNNVPSL